jgi:hypothetical protein
MIPRNSFRKAEDLDVTGSDKEVVESLSAGPRPCKFQVDDQGRIAAVAFGHGLHSQQMAKLSGFAAVRQLIVFDLEDSGRLFDEEIVATIAQTATLHDLFMQNVRIPFPSLDRLTQINFLRRLRLNNCSIDDAGARLFARMKDLTVLNLHGNPVSPSVLSHLRKELPACSVYPSDSDTRSD